MSRIYIPAKLRSRYPELRYNRRPLIREPHVSNTYQRLRYTFTKLTSTASMVALKMGPPSERRKLMAIRKKLKGWGGDE